MPTPFTSDYPATALDTVVTLGEAGNRVSTTLGAALASGATSLTLTSAPPGMPNTGALTINPEGGAAREIVYYNGVSGTTVSNLLRGREGTTDQAHSIGDLLEQRVTAR